MSEKDHLSATVDAANVRWLEQFDNRSAFINRLLTQARKTGNPEQAGLDLQIQQKRRELQNAQDRVENLQRDLDELERMRRRMADKEPVTVQEAREALDVSTLDPTNPAVQNWAEKAGLTEHELIDRLQQ